MLKIILYGVLIKIWLIFGKNYSGKSSIIDGILYTLFNSGQIVIPYKRNVTDIIQDIEKFSVELLPTTPTFLRMLLFDNNLNLQKLRSLKIIT